jgi:hypothetical protein
VSRCGTGFIEVAFDRTNPEAVAYAEARAGEMVTAVTSSVRDTIREIITRAFTEKITPAETAALIRDTVGLTVRDATAVLNLRRDLIDGGATKAQVKKQTTAYADGLLKRRAETIARTEIMRASNEGTAQLWSQAKDRGLLTGDEKKVWIAADPCPECEDVDGEEVGIFDDFSVGTNPPLHPNCLCTIGLIA